MNFETRSTAMWLGLIGVALGVVAIVAAVAGDMRVAVGWGVAVAALAILVGAIGALVGPYRPMAAAGLMLVGVIGILVGQWSEISQWSVDLWTAATGGPVTYVWRGVTYTPDVWGVLFGSVSMLGYAGALLFGVVGAIVASFAPEPETTQVRPAMHRAAL